MTCGHAAHGFASTQHRSGDIHSEGFVDRFGCELVYASESAGDSGIIDKCFDRAEFPLCRFEKAKDIVLAGDVCVDGEGAAAVLNDIGCDLCRLSFASAVIHRHCVAALGCETGDGCANAAAGTSDDERAQVLGLRTYLRRMFHGLCLHGFPFAVHQLDHSFVEPAARFMPLIGTSDVANAHFNARSGGLHIDTRQSF